MAIPPHGEELHLDLSESLVRILEKLIDSSGNDHVDLSSLDILRRASKILVHRLQPAYIVVRVRAYMDVKMIGGILSVYSLQLLLSMTVRVVDSRSLSRLAEVQVNHGDG